MVLRALPEENAFDGASGLPLSRRQASHVDWAELSVNISIWRKAQRAIALNAGLRVGAGVSGPGLLGLVLTVQVAFIAAQMPSAPANYAAAASQFKWTAGLVPCDARAPPPHHCTIACSEPSRTILSGISRITLCRPPTRTV